QMSVAPRYAFVILEPGITKREVFLNLSLYGDVRIMSKISEVSSLVTELVTNLESANVADNTHASPVVETLPSTQPVRVSQRSLPSAYRSDPSSSDSVPSTRRSTRNVVPIVAMPEPLPIPPFITSSSTLRGMPTFASAQLKAQQLLQKMVQNEKESDQALLSMVKTEDDDPLVLFDANQHPLKEESPFDETGASKDGIERQYEDPDDVNDEPCSSALAGLDDQVMTEMAADDIQLFMDEEGNIEVPYNPDFEECRPRRQEDTREAGSKQAQCDVCKRWVRITNTLSRLIAHVFMHTQKQRYACPINECGWSNKAEAVTRRHIINVHGRKMDPIDIQTDKKSHSESWKVDRCKWAPRCFPNHFETAPGGDIFMRVNEKTTLMR
ncbi:hypothetical protein PENTCL1PPCAC_27271, partial [Pristionchus entomophagus]